MYLVKIIPFSSYLLDIIHIIVLQHDLGLFHDSSLPFQPGLFVLDVLNVQYKALEGPIPHGTLGKSRIVGLEHEQIRQDGGVGGGRIHDYHKACFRTQRLVESVYHFGMFTIVEFVGDGGSKEPGKGQESGENRHGCAQDWTSESEMRCDNCYPFVLQYY